MKRKDTSNQPTATVADGEQVWPDDVLHYNYNGVPIDTIIEEYCAKQGISTEQHTPGECKAMYYQLAIHFRYLCDSNPDVLLCHLPELGIALKERKKTVKNSVERALGTTIPHPLYQIMRDKGWHLTAEEQEAIRRREEEEMDRELAFYEKQYEPEKLPAHLPPVIREWVETAPVHYKRNTIAVLLPILGTMATFVRYDRNGKTFAPNFQTVVMAPPAHGKSMLMNIRRDMMRDYQPLDDEAFDAMARYDREVRGCINSHGHREMPQEPTLVMRQLGPRMGVSAFLKQQKWAQHVHQLIYTDEISEVTNNREFEGFRSIFNKAFDNEHMMQLFYTPGLTYACDLYVNILLMGNYHDVADLYDEESAATGLLSRAILSPIRTPPYEEMPHWARFTPEQQAVIDKFKQWCFGMLYDTDADGHSTLRHGVTLDVTPYMGPAMKALDRWDEKKCEEVITNDNNALDIVRRRYYDYGHHIAALSCALYGGQPTAEEQRHIAKFVIWFLDYMTEEMLAYGGEWFERMMNPEVKRPWKGATAIRMLSQLPNEFNLGQLARVLADNGCHTPAKNMAYRWNRDGYIHRCGQGSYRKTRLGQT